MSKSIGVLLFLAVMLGGMLAAGSQPVDATTRTLAAAPARDGLAADVAAAAAQSTLGIKLTATTPVSNALFGYSVVIQGDVAVVGAPQDDVAGDRAGAAYVYRFNGSTWSVETRLTASDGEAGDLFGTSVAIDGSTIVIGARGRR
jgi:hypothetical protein